MHGCAQKYGFVLLISIVLSITFAFSSRANSTTITIGGTGNAIGTMRHLAKAYQNANPNITVRVLPSIGSSGAIKATPRGSIDIGLSARPLKSTELNLGIIATLYASTPTIIAVSNKTQVEKITIAQMVDIYSGKLKKWPDGSVIRPIIRQAGDDNTKQLKRLSPELQNAIEIAEKRQGLLFAATDQETVDKIEKTPGSFSVTSLALLLSEKRNIHSLILNDIEPTIENMISGDYPMVKHFYFILPLEQSQKVKEFIKFVFSFEGAAILRAYGNYPVQQ
jgi:phosphate transport system substrate-binding protein